MDPYAHGTDARIRVTLQGTENLLASDNYYNASILLLQETAAFFRIFPRSRVGFGVFCSRTHPGFDGGGDDRSIRMNAATPGML